ncbi:hypothetical protein VUR80DRAFT_6917 [Thermomyces stellatus]
MVSAHAVFRVIYNAVYTFFYILLVGLVVITPADVIFRAHENKQGWNIWIVIASYVITLVVVAFVYATRLYINKTALAAIPKQWIPIEKGDVHPSVHRLIKYGLDRSAAIAFEARPRIRRFWGAEGPGTEGTEDEGERRASGGLRLRRSMSVEEDQVVLPPHQPVWGDIEQPGWGSPTSPDLADVQYSTVFLELPTLIEAKAITFAPEVQADPPTLDPEAITLLQRPVSMDLRDYLSHLSSLGILPLSPTVMDFINSYERARFSTKPISNAEFRELMRLFSEVLRSMGPAEAVGGSRTPTISDPSLHERPYTSSSDGSRFQRRVLTRSPDEWEFRTAPTTPKSAATSNDGFARTRRPYPASSPSNASLGSGSRSVLKLGKGSDDGYEL